MGGLDTPARPLSWNHTWVSSAACVVGLSFCVRSSLAKPVALLLTAASMSRLPTTPCARLYRPVGQFTLLATCLVTFLVTWMRRSSMWSTMLQILSTRSLSFLHAGLVPRLTQRARLRPCWGKQMLQQSPGFRRKKTELKGSLDQCPKSNLAEFWTASFTVLDDKAGVVSRVSSATGDTVHNCCASRDLHVKCEHNDLHC